MVVDLARMWLVTQKLDRCSPSMLADLERALAASLAPSHRTFLERFGTGSFIGILRVWGPDAILEQREQARVHRLFAPEHVRFWSNYDAYFDTGDGAHLLPIATSIDGDMVVLRSGRSDALFVFPRHSDTIEELADFEDVLGWFSSGPVWQRTAKTWFESRVDRVEHRVTLAGTRPDPHEAVGHLLDDLPPDYEGASANPTDDLFYRDAAAIVQWVGNGKLRVRTDVATAPTFLTTLSKSLERGGWTATIDREAHVSL